MAIEIMEGYVQISERGLSPVMRMIDGLGKSATRVVTGPLRAFAAGIEGLGKIGLAGMGVSTFGAAFQALNPASFLQAAAAAETLEVSMATMLKSGDKAKALIDDLNQFANVTPFDNTQVNESAKLLMSFGISVDQIIPTLNVLGSVAAGSGSSLQDLGMIFGQVKAAGRLMTQDMMQLAGRGIPILQELAKHFGLPEEEVGKVREMIEKGKVSFADFQQVMNNMGTGNGTYAGQMDAKSKTVEGLWSTLEGQSGLVKQGIGKILTEAWQLPQRMTEIVATIDSIIPNIPQLMAPVIPALTAIGDAVWGAFDWFQSAGPGVATFLQGLVPTFDAAAAAVRDVFGYAIDYASGAVNFFLSTLQGLSDGGFFETLQSVATSSFRGISSVIGLAQQQMVFMKPYTDAWLQVFYKGGQLVATVFSKAWESIRGIGEVLGFMGSQLDGKILPSMGGINQAFRDFGLIAVNSIGQAIDNVRFFFENLDVMIPMGFEKLRIFASNVPELIRVAFVNGYRWAEWFFGNFSDIMGTLGDYAMTTFMNLKNNLVGLFTALWKWVQSGFSGEFEYNWTPLTDGFQSQIKEWPKLLEAKLNETSPELDGLRKQFEERRIDWERNEKEAALKRDMGKSPIAQMAESANSYDPGAMAINEGKVSGDAAEKATKKSGDDDISAKRYGSAEAFSRILANINRKTDSKHEKLLQAQLAEQKKISSGISGLGNSGIEIVAGSA